MILDLTREGALTPGQAREMDAIAEELRAPFHQLMAELSAPHAGNLDWWVSQVASRNTFSSSLYLRCCQAQLATRAARMRPAPDAILVDSPALADTLALALGAGIPVRCTVPRWRDALALRVRRARALAAALYSFAGRILAARLRRPRRHPPAGTAITLVDTFLFADSLDEAGRLRDHYYPGMLEWLTVEERAALWLAPTFFRVRRPFRLFGRIRRSPLNFLLPDDYLRLPDYAHALRHPWRVPRIAPGPRPLAGMDVAPLLREAEAAGFAASGTLEALLRHRFALRLKEKGVRPRMVLEWYENQELDRGAVAGMHQAFPGVPVLGYQGYVVSRHYLCMFPTSGEQAAGLVPQSLAVVGPAFVEPAREFCAGLAVETAPAFRFRNAWKDTPPPREDFLVLAALPIHLAEARDIVERLAEACRPYGGRWRVALKPHPLAPLSRIGAVPEGWETASGELDALIARAGILVSSASSACVQALAAGVPVAVMGSLRGLTQNPVPADAERRLWDLCYTAEDLRASIDRFASRGPEQAARDRAAGRALRERFFTPVTRQTVARMLRLA